MSDTQQPDELLAGGLPTEVETVDTSPAIEPKDFDFAGFLDGVRPTRRSVKLFPKAHLIARMEEIADEIHRTPENVNVDKLIDEFEACKADFNDGVWFTLEKRSSEWVEDYRKSLAKTLDLDLSDITDEDDDAKKDAKGTDRMTALVHQLAEQIVVPSGVTSDGLRRLGETNEGELNKLVVTMGMVNESLAEKAQVVTVDFSQRRSTNRRARRGSAR